jgi:hypothetical protein
MRELTPTTNRITEADPAIPGVCWGCPDSADAFVVPGQGVLTEAALTELLSGGGEGTPAPLEEAVVAQVLHATVAQLPARRPPPDARCRTPDACACTCRSVKAFYRHPVPAHTMSAALLILPGALVVCDGWGLSLGGLHS